jgi:hypothetical protein
MDWAGLFERAAEYEVTTDEIAAALERRRERDGESNGGDESDGGATTAAPGESVEPSPVRVVADADVLAADLLVGDPSRAALDRIFRHDWVVLVASDALLADAEAIVAELADADLAAEWRTLLEREREAVDHPAGDHPALASALHGGAMHVLTCDEALQSARTGAAVRGHVEASLKSPDAFARLFDPERLYPVVAEGDYPGPDREPRA